MTMTEDSVDRRTVPDMTEQTAYDELKERAEAVLRNLRARGGPDAAGAADSKNVASASRGDLDARVEAGLAAAKERARTIVGRSGADPPAGQGPASTPADAVPAPSGPNTSSGPAPLTTSAPEVATSAHAGPDPAPAVAFEPDDAYFAELRHALDGHTSMGTAPPVAAVTAAVLTPTAVPVPAEAPPIDGTPTPAAPAIAVVDGDVQARTLPVPVAIPEPGGSPTPPAAPASAAPSVLSKRKARIALAGLLLRDVSLLALLFLAFQFWGSNLFTGGAQRSLREQFAAEGKTNAVPKPGSAMAIMEIPSIGLRQAVVEGTTVGDIRRGPGHFVSTPLPGQPGNAVITGARSTYGASFERLDEIAVGDKIRVRTHQGSFVYIVKGQRVVWPSDRDLLVDHRDNRLTLTSAHPKLSPRQRIVVWAALAPSSTPAAPASTAPLATPATLASEDPGWFHDNGMWLPSFFWALVLVGAYLGMHRLATRWDRRKAMLLGVPVLVLLMWPLFVNLGRAFPANL